MLVLLPQPSQNQPYFNITTLEGGFLSLPEQVVVSDPNPDRIATVPSLAFLLRHTSDNHKVLFDLGINKDLSKYTPATIDWIKKYFLPVSANPDVIDSLKNSGHGLTPSDITHVILSHVHW